MIRPVTVSEAEAAVEVYHLCAQHMNAHGFYNWNAGYPSYKEALADARAGSLYGYYHQG